MLDPRFSEGDEVTLRDETAMPAVPSTPVSPKDRAWLIDYHLHTAHSFDSTAPVESVVERAVAAGLDAICITDHDTIEGALEARRLAPPELHVIIGSEVTLRDGSQILGMDLSREVVRDDLEAAVADIHAQGGLVLMPHPFRRGSGLLRPERGLSAAETTRILALVDLVEAHNGRDTWENNQRSHRIVAERGLAGVAGSDAHRADEVGRTFVAYEARPDQHGRGTRTIWAPAQRELHESPVKRRVMEWYHAHERQLPGVVRDGYRSFRRRTHAEGPRVTDAPPVAQLTVEQGQEADP